MRFISSFRTVITAVALPLLCALDVGCSGAPGAPAGSDTETATAPMAFAPASGDEASDDASTPCAPGDRRTCKRVWRDDSGITNCAASLQFCAEDGSGWHDCGDYSIADDGTEIPPKGK